MLKDFGYQKKIDVQAVVAAIKSLKEQGKDINPYTVADEVNIPRQLFCRQMELMDLVMQARQKANTSLASDKTMSNTSNLGAQNQELMDEIAVLKEQNESLLKQQQEAWQAGYETAIEELKKSTIEFQNSDTVYDAPPTSTKSSWTSQIFTETNEKQPTSNYNFDASAKAKSPGTNETQDESSFDEEQLPSESNPISKEAHTDLQESKLNTAAVNEDELHDLLKQRFARAGEETEPGSKREDNKQRKIAGTKFVGGHRNPTEPPVLGASPRNVPPNIRKSCLVLGLRPEELTVESVHQAWKQELSKEHPDLGGDTEIAVYLNKAKETLLAWIAMQAPKLGKKFGSFHNPSANEDKDQADHEH